MMILKRFVMFEFDWFVELNFCVRNELSDDCSFVKLTAHAAEHKTESFKFLQPL